MFEDFHPFRGRDGLPNCFWPVGAAEIEAAEAALGYAISDQLAAFYREVGYGFYTRGVEDARETHVNRVIDPGTVADLVTGAACEGRPPEGFAPGAMPFFELGERTYLVLLPTSATPNRVYGPGGVTVVSEGVVEFFAGLYRRAGFYKDAWRAGKR